MNQRNKWFVNDFFNSQHAVFVNNPHAICTDKNNCLLNIKTVLKSRKLSYFSTVHNAGMSIPIDFLNFNSEFK